MASPIVLNTAEGFLGIADPEARARALTMPLGELVKRIECLLSEQALVLSHVTALNEMAYEHLPADTDNMKAEALIAAVPSQLERADNALCEFGGCFEALIVRLKEASHGEH